MLLLKQADASGKGRAGSDSVQGQLLEALIDTILDAGNPPVCNPFLTSLCQQVVPLVLKRAGDHQADTRVSSSMTSIISRHNEQAIRPFSSCGHQKQFRVLAFIMTSVMFLQL